MVIPEGDWYCPDCQHSGLIEGLEAKLKSYAALYKSKEAEIKRRERLAFVSMSLQNIIPSSRDKFHPAKANPKASQAHGQVHGHGQERPRARPLPLGALPGTAFALPA